MNKEIQKIKIAITSNCTLRCLHCKIDKSSNLTAKLSDVYKGVDLLINSPGKYKRLEIYGGEPFTEIKNLKKIVSYTQKTAKKRKIKLSIHIATNATLINDDVLKWLKKNKNIIIAVSFNGTQNSQDKIRKFNNQNGSYIIVKKNIKKILKTIGTHRLVIIYCVDPIFAKNIYKDFKEIIKIGIRIVDIECAHGRGWNSKNYNEFEKNINKINNYILNQTKKENFIFHEKFIELLRMKGKEIPKCPFYIDLEMYPDAKLGFYPYAFINYLDFRDKIKIGDINKGINKKYLYCSYNPYTNICKNCITNYYTLEGLYDGTIAYKIREKEINKLFRKIISKAKKEKIFKLYLINLKKILKEFYK